VRVSFVCANFHSKHGSCHAYRVQRPLLLSELNQNWYVSTSWTRTSQSQILRKARLSIFELSHADIGAFLPLSLRTLQRELTDPWCLRTLVPDNVAPNPVQCMEALPPCKRRSAYTAPCFVAEVVHPVTRIVSRLGRSSTGSATEDVHLNRLVSERRGHSLSLCWVLVVLFCRRFFRFEVLMAVKMSIVGLLRCNAVWTCTSTLRMEEAYTSEALGSSYKLSRRCNPEDQHRVVLF
jgi:hypothetical protein